MKQLGYSIIYLGILVFSCTQVNSQTPVELHGKLRVFGNQIAGEHGKPVQLMGMSHYWSVWGPQKYYNKKVVNWQIGRAHV